MALAGWSALPATPVDITNSGDITVDQDTGWLEISGEVEVHQPPFYLYSDKVSWNQNESLLYATGKVRIMVDPKEPGAESFFSRAESTDYLQDTEKREILTTTSLLYNTKTQNVEPEGISKIQFGAARIIGEDFSLNLRDDSVRTGRYRVGIDTLFLEGDGLEAQGDSLLAKNARFFFGEPENLSIQGSAREVEKVSDEAVIMRGIWLKVGPVPVFYLPRYMHSLKRRTFSLTGGAGYSGDIGLYTELRPIYRPTNDLSLYTDVNFYTERGVLLGPGFELTKQTANGQSIHARLETGYIQDNGVLGRDVLQEPIDSSRHFIDLDYVHRVGDSFHVLSKVQRWSDSEILRDFDGGKFRSIQQPENFIEAIWLSGSWALTASTVFRHEDFEYATERLPELKMQLLPSPMPGTGFYHSASAEGAMLRDSNPDGDEVIEHTRFRAYYELFYPVALNSWLDFTPQATYQTLYYSDEGENDRSFQNQHFEVGFDLSAHAYGEWNLQRSVWDIRGIRHLVMPTLQVRKISDIGSQTNVENPIERDIFRTGLDDIDLSAFSHLDDLEAHTVIRTGIKNSVVAKSAGGTTRELLKFDLFHDFYIPDAEESDDRSMLTANLQLKPAHWVRLDLQSRFNTEDFGLNDLFGRLRLVDGDIWDIDLSSQFLRNELQQYLVKFRYKLFENVRLVSLVGYDAENSRFYEQTYGVQIGLSNYWDLYLSVNTRDGSRRNNQTRFELKVLSAQF